MQGVTDWAVRMKEMMEFVGLTEAELELVQSTAPIILQHADHLTDAIYDHFLHFPDARRFFVTNEGEVDQDRLARRKHSLVRWLRNTMELDVDEGLPGFLLAIGLVHSHPPAHRAHLGPVPVRYMIGTISFAQTALTQLFQQEMADPQAAMGASVAWSKLLMVQLDVLLAGYVAEQDMDANLGG